VSADVTPFASDLKIVKVDLKNIIITFVKIIKG
jgi:hypothetical protein